MNEACLRLDIQDGIARLTFDPPRRRNALTAAMWRDEGEHNGLALGAWGAVQATAAGVGIALGGVIRDLAAGLAAGGAFGPGLEGPAFGYGFVYTTEIVLLFATLALIGPLVRYARPSAVWSGRRLGLAELPG